MGDTITRSMTFELQDCISCQIAFMVPVGFTARRREDNQTFYCPNGHTMSYPKYGTEAEKLRRERDRLKQEAARLEEQAALENKWRLEAQEAARAAERRAAAARGQVTRLKNRAVAGLCPCCNRSFVQLSRHMSTKHPGFERTPHDP